MKNTQENLNLFSSLYLELLKKVLTNTIFSVEPDTEDKNISRFVAKHVQQYQQSNAVSMLPIVRFDNLQSCIENVIRDNIPGDLIETGVWRGGATIFMRAVLKVHEITDRKVWVADSFEGLPEPDAEKFPLEAASYNSAAMTKFYDHLAVSLEDVQENFRSFAMLDEQVMFLKGWFCDTLPTAPIEKLAIMRLDGDYYESTMDALVGLYDRLAPGGYLIVDDFGEDNWTYCSKAVHDFRGKRGITDPIIRVDKPCSYWRKSG